MADGEVRRLQERYFARPSLFKEQDYFNALHPSPATTEKEIPALTNVDCPLSTITLGNYFPLVTYVGEGGLKRDIWLIWNIALCIYSMHFFVYINHKLYFTTIYLGQIR